jgi:diguanylate cyclase (GGDEF)-like protein
MENFLAFKPDAAEDNTNRELLDLLYKNAPITLFSSMAVAVLLYSVINRSPDSREDMLSWVTAMMLANLARLLLRSIRESSYVTGRYHRFWLASYALITMLAGIVWTMLLVVVQTTQSFYEQLIILATLVGVPIAALPNNSLRLPVYYAFSVPIFIAIQYWAIFVSQELNLQFSIFGVALGIITFVTSHTYHNNYKALIRIKYEKQKLVDDLSAANRRLEEFAYKDPLTGLTNRRWFSEQADHALERCQRRNNRLAVLLIDLDNFKEINDTLGHTKGDDILIVIAKRLKSALRQSDTLSMTSGDTARYGGDEFILLLEDFSDIKDVESASDRILQEVNKPITLNDHQFKPGCSIGISIYPDDAQSVSNLIRQADIALYQAKQSGKGCTRFFNPLSLDAIRSE